MEELWKLESVELSESSQFVSKVTQRLKTNRDPALLGELVEYYFKNGSKRARKVLTSLRETHSQDYFDKLYEGIQKTSTRLPVLKLLAHTLNSETSWLYRIVDHPLFSAILDQLKLSNDIIVLCSGLFVLTALLPLVPSYISKKLTDLFAVFCSLATIRHTKRLGLAPKELYLHLDVAVYYFFLQLYALFPNNFVDYLRKEYESDGQEAHIFAESIAPLFNLVQLHPSLITGGRGFELSMSKWRSMEPDDIATLSLQLCLDKHLATPGTTSLSCLDSSHDAYNPVWQFPQPDDQPPPVAGPLQEMVASSNTTLLSGLSNPEGLKSSEELEKFISPLQALGSTTPHYSNNVSPNDSSRSSVNFLIQPSLQASAISSPLSDSNLSSTAPTPRGVTTSKFTYKNYSPTASIDSDLVSSKVTQSAVHAPSEDSFNGFQVDPLSQSMRLDSTASQFPSRKGIATTQSHSLKNRVEKFIGIFVSQTPKISRGANDNDFTEIHISELDQTPDPRTRKKISKHELSIAKHSVKAAAPEALEEVGEECVPDIAKVTPDKESDIKQSAASLAKIQPQSLPSSRQSRSESRSSRSGCVPSQYSELEKEEVATEKDCDTPVHFSFSYPERGPSEIMVKRVRSSNSEASTRQTVLMVQERLKELVESEKQYTSTAEDGKPLRSSTPTEKECSAYDSSLSLDLSTESKATVLAHGSGAGSPMQNKQSTPLALNLSTSLDKNPAVTSVSSSGPAIGGSVSANTLGVDCLLVKRVSVGAKKERNQLSDSSAQSLHTGSVPALAELSPLALLDQYVRRGVVLHKGHFETIPLTELEGVDWNHFGGCPHTEEFGMMQAQVVLLHSQLMFERYQCLQHARRNRTLLSQARSASKVTEELHALRGRVQNLNSFNMKLQTELQRKTLALSGAIRFQATLKSQNQAIFTENNYLKDKNEKFVKEVKSLEEKNGQLQKKLDQSLHEVVGLKNDQVHFQSRLEKADSSRCKVEQLSQELQILGDLYYQSKQEGLFSLNQDHGTQEFIQKINVLSREKHEAESRLRAQSSQLAVSSAKVQELEITVSQRENIIRNLQEKLRTLEGCYNQKLKALEDKYQSMKVVCLQLENTILELRSRSTSLARKRRHKRSSSHPTGGQASLKPSPPQQTHRSSDTVQ